MYACAERPAPRARRNLRHVLRGQSVTCGATRRHERRGPRHEPRGPRKLRAALCRYTMTRSAARGSGAPSLTDVALEEALRKALDDDFCDDSRGLVGRDELLEPVGEGQHGEQPEWFEEHERVEHE